MQHTQTPHYLIVGNGRMAHHMQCYLEYLAIPYQAWNRAESQSALKTKIQTTSHVLLLINDDCIDAFIQANAFIQSKTLVHFSGTLLSPYAYTAHPLQTFSHELYALADYEAVSFIIEAEGPAFNHLLPGLSNPSYPLPRHLKLYYHTLCVMANNFTTLLWQKFFTALTTELDIPVKAGIPFLQQTCKNLQVNYQTALTGPLARQDTNTLAANLSLLQHKKDPYFSIFKSFLDSLYPNLEYKPS